MSGPFQVAAEVVGVRRVGAYVALILAAPSIAAEARPGHFVALSVGGPATSMVLRRCFSLAGWGNGAVTVLFSVLGHGTDWLASRQPGDLVEVGGPLGTPFALPSGPQTCVLVGGGTGAAPLIPLAVALTELGSEVRMLIGAARAEKLMAVEQARLVADSVTITTDDGSAGLRGWVSDALPGLLAGADAVYGCGPMRMLRSVAGLAAAVEVPSQVAVEEAMACGVGVCMTCVLPILGDDGRTRMLRACLEGPVFAGDRVRFDAVGTVPADAVGAS
ncbi:MAG: dihydroorotate dehydrogenase electron transfer subunit [Frankiaceae bacterium]